MTRALLGHIAESSLFALLVWAIALASNRAAVRNRLWIAAVLKFAVPFSWFVALGASVGRHFLVAPMHLPTLYATAVGNAGRQAAQIHTTSWAWTVCLICWAGVSIFLLAIWLRRFAESAAATVAAGQEEKAALRRCAARMQIKKLPHIRLASQLMEPYVLGTLRPVIVVPLGLYVRLGEDVFESVLMHELAHIKRKDNLWSMAVHAVVCVFPWYPPIWWMERKVRGEAELACDALALEAGAPREAYVSGLVEVCRMLLLEPHGGSGFTSGVNLKNRLERIMSNRVEEKSSRLLCQLGGSLLAGSCILAFVFGAMGSGRGMAQTTTTPTAISAAVRCEIGQPQSFAVGTVVRHVDSKVMQVCIAQNGRPLWLSLDSNRLPSGLIAVDLVAPPASSVLFLCKETAPHGKLCTCDNLDFSPGAVVKSPRGALACPASGGQWQLFKGKETPWPPVSLLQN